jgi:AraC family transcriptional regulator of adaptative response/methylated-DNA-[protein]-cysteine methyltransferase
MRPTLSETTRRSPPEADDRDVDDRDALRWRTVLARDHGADGVFVYSVRTTGVYCRPSCPSRAARRENVDFHETCAAAEGAGFRACARCHPNGASQAERDARLVARACRLIEAAETAPTLDGLARSAGLGASRFHRVFKSVTGVTPRAYASAHRAARAEAGLRAGGTITAAIHDAGFNAASRFYETADARLGMTPSAFRAGGDGARIMFAIGQCSLGAVLVAATAKGVCAILIGDDPDTLVGDLRDRFSRATIIAGDAAFEATVATVIGFVEAPRAELALPLDIAGTAFQQRVWAALRAIPAGTTVSYTDIARAIGQPSATRAVASACGANSIAVAIPCHRVVRADGGLSGYRWGVARKRALLDREAEGSSSCRSPS